MSPTHPSPTSQSTQPIFIVVMGVSGTGKTTLGSAIGRALCIPYVEGDEIHPASNVAKMSSGIPLTDADREPWLALIRSTAERMTLGTPDIRIEPASGTRQGSGVVISCSALKRYYRDILRGVDGSERELSTYFVFIEGSRAVLMDRMERRPGHFMKASMLDSQLQTLESPVGEDGVVAVSVEASTEEQVQKAIEGLHKLAGYDIRSNLVIA